MKYIAYFWNHPYPDTLLWPLRKLAAALSGRAKAHPVSDAQYRGRCAALSAAALVLLFFLTGAQNPLAFFVDIPVYNWVEFSRLSGGDEYALYLYVFFSAIAASAAVFLLRICLLGARECSFFSVNGVCFFVAGVLIAAVLDVPIQPLAIAFSRGVFAPLALQGETGLLILGAMLNFFAYFAMQDSFAAVLASAVGIQMVLFFSDFFPQFAANRLVLFVAISLLLRIFLEALDRAGLWAPLVRFVAKWFYTPRYVVKIVWFILRIGLFPILPKRPKKREEDAAGRPAGPRGGGGSSL